MIKEVKLNSNICKIHQEEKIFFHGQKRCVSCRKEYIKHRNKSPQHKASKKKYNSSIKGKTKNREFANLSLQKTKRKIRNSLLEVKIKKDISRNTPERIAAKNKYNVLYRKQPKSKEIRNASRKKRRETDSFYKMTENVRRRIYSCFKAKNFIKENTKTLIGCDLKVLFSYIESLFKPGMNWQNQGKKGWQLDHTIPLASARTQQELIKLCHYSNLQPLWHNENLIKSDKMPNGISFRKLAKNES